MNHVLLCLTANHRNASFETLEALSTGAHLASESLVRRGEIDGAVVLATCNRFEAYLDVREPGRAVSDTFAELAAESGVDATELQAQITVLDGDEVAEHLFAVSSGLESVVVGEDEISGQVRRALEQARTSRTSTSGLEKLFQRASHTSRGVKNRTNLGGAGRSLVRLALDMTATRVADWSLTRVLVVGTGQYAATTVANLRDRGVRDLLVFSPSGRGSRFSVKHGLALETDLARAIANSDIVITCTAALAVTAADVAPGRRLIIDLGLPRNVDPGVAQVEGVQLLDLETIRLHAPLPELSAASDARAMVADAAAEFAAEAVIEPAVVALRTHVLGVLEAEIARLHDDDARTERALRHLAGVLLHAPSERARELARDGRADDFVNGVEAVFGVEVAQPAASRESNPATA